MTAKTRVLVVGPAPPGPTSRGGMATVAGLMVAHPDPSVDIRLVTTYVDGAAAQRLRIGLAGMLNGVITVLKKDVDVVHVHLSHGGSVVRKSPVLWAARLRGIPSVVHGHSYDFGGWVDRLPRAARPLVRAALPADHWLVLGNGLADQYRAALGIPADRVEVLYNPVPPASADRTDDASPGLVEVVTLGRLGARKGSYDLIAAVAALPVSIRDRLHLTMAGDGEVDEVRAAVHAAGVTDAFTIKDWVAPAERDELLAAASVFALPSYDEGLPMALLEAMAAGLAPLTTPVGGIPEAVTDGVDGILVPPGDVSAISTALARLVTEPELRAALASAARSRTEAFSIEAWHTRLSELWSALAAPRTGRIHVLGVGFDDHSFESAVALLQAAALDGDTVRSVAFPNAATLNIAAHDSSYRDALNAASFVFGDGTGVRWAARMRGVELRSNLNGTDVIPALLASTPGLKVFLLGSTDEVNAAAAETVRRDFPKITVVGRHHGYFDLDESGDVIAEIEAAAPDLLLVGFGNPLQEQWIQRNRHTLSVPLIAGIGGLFGFWAGTRTRASALTRRAGMEWLDILIREPHKARRYLLGNPVFLYRAARSRGRDRRAVPVSACAR